MYSPLTKTLVNLKNKIFHPEIIQEVATSYNHKLPTHVEVSWFRDGDFIIGNINIEGNVVMTQAKSAEEFVEMVNETIYAVCEVPTSYALHGNLRKLVPPDSEYQKLTNNLVKSSTMGLETNLA